LLEQEIHLAVALSRQGEIGIVTIDNPPVNSISKAVRQGLIDAVAATEADAGISAVVLVCAGRTFIAGADIREFDKPPVEPHLPDVLSAIEQTSKPWVAAIHGTALGGGLETAMVCNVRIASKDAKFGLPEVTLGLIPGAGGTVRLPRLVPAEAALSMIAVGKPIGANAALQAGLINAIAEHELLADAILLAKQAGVSEPVISRPVNVPENRAAFDAKVAKIINKARGQQSPQAAVHALENAFSLPAVDALLAERETFLTLKSDPQAAALRHVFFAERATAKVQRIKDVEPLALNEIGVVGGGTMGAGICAAALLAGFTVRMIERDSAAAEAGSSRVAGILDDSLKRGLINEDKHHRLLNAFNASCHFVDLGACNLIIEAVFEEMQVKKTVFAKIEAVAKPDAVLATNTSYLDVNDIAASTQSAHRVIGLHFFSPAHIMKLLEIVVPSSCNNIALATAVSFAKSLRKLPVLAGVCDGFIANRIMSAYRCEAEYMIEDGAMPWVVDKAMVDFGFPLGIFQMGDLAGLDIAWAMRKRQTATRDPDLRYVDIPDKLCENGRFGRKTGSGYYLYDNDAKGRPDPEVEALILAESKRKGIARQTMTAEHIMERILGVIQREGRKILDEGIAQSADDIDVVMVNAFAFPRWRGGPMFMLRYQQPEKAGFEGMT
jgi:3-hydroxyacyl-CoA dehydrogenase